MSLPELLFIAIGLSMDAFAVAACAGLTMSKVTIKKALIVGLYFGVFQAVMPLIGYALATRFANRITALDHWIAFILLCMIGGKMILESFKKDHCAGVACSPEANVCSNPEDECSVPPEVSLGPEKMLPLALATSIDALAVGVSFAFLKVRIGMAVLLIGLTTLILSVAGVKIGHAFGTKLKSKAELAGGIILLLIGLKILFEHLGILG